MIMSGRDAHGPKRLRRDPERIGLVEADISAGIPGVIAFLRHVAHFGADHDRLADAVHGADREHLVGVGLQDLVPRLAALLVVGRVLPFLDVVEELAGLLHVALLALLALGFDVHAPFGPVEAALHGRRELLRARVLPGHAAHYPAL